VLDVPIVLDGHSDYVGDGADDLARRR
jgi:hypothetical protein